MDIFLRFLKLSLFTIGVLYFLSMLLLYIFQDRLLYITTPNCFSKQNGFYLPNSKSFVNSENLDNKDAIIYFGGNAEDSELTINEFKNSFKNYALYFLEYRGYGKSKGKPNQKDIIEDAIKLYDEVKKRHSRVYIIGRSLGSGVAQFVANKREVDKLILVTPYSSIEDVAKSRFPFFPVSLLLKDKYRVIDLADHLKAKEILIILASNDEVIPKDVSKKLIYAIKKAKVITLTDSNHNSIVYNSQYFKVIKDFIKE